MNRILILGRGASGKSTLATRLSTRTGIPLVELDSVFWSASLTPTPPEEWVALQHKLIAEPRWILDGDLGPYDVLETRLSAADTVVLLDFSLFRCSWRALRRSRERLDFWLWLVFWRRRSRPAIPRRHHPPRPDHRATHPTQSCRSGTLAESVIRPPSPDGASFRMASIHRPSIFMHRA